MSTDFDIFTFDRQSSIQQSRLHLLEQIWGLVVQFLGDELLWGKWYLLTSGCLFGNYNHYHDIAVLQLDVQDHDIALQEDQCTTTEVAQAWATYEVDALEEETRDRTFWNAPFADDRGYWSDSS